MPQKYLNKILNARVYDVAKESPLDKAANLSARLGNTVLIKRAPTSGISVLPTERFTNKYGAYAVFGNLLMLCETELATCEALMARFD